MVTINLKWSSEKKNGTKNFSKSSKCTNKDKHHINIILKLALWIRFITKKMRFSEEICYKMVRLAKEN